MSRIVLAFKLFFLILFNRRIGDAVAAAYEQARSGQAPPPTAKDTVSKKPGKTPTEPGVPLGAVASVLSLLQREARFVDFLMEDVDGFSDAQVGAAARTVHRGCRKALRDYVELQPVRAEKEGDSLTVEAGFDPYAVRLTGNLTGDPPFQGVLRHHGWRLVKANLPSSSANQDIVMPAEVEI